MTTYDHEFGPKSLANLNGVLPSLVQVAKLAITLCRFDGTVISGGGIRTQAQADTNVANGPGTANPRPRKQADGFGPAIALIPLHPGTGPDAAQLTPS